MIFLAACEQEPATPPLNVGTTAFDLPRAELTARAELNEIAKVILQDDDVRQEVFDLTLQPRYIDLYVELDHLLNPDGYESDETNPVPTRGSFRKAFDKVYEPSVHATLAEALSPEGLNSRTGELDGSNFYLYCPYCEDYSTEQMNGPFAVAVDTFVDLGDEVQTVPGSEIEAGVIVDANVTDDYMVSTPTILLIGKPSGGLTGLGNGPGGPDRPDEEIKYETTRCRNGTCCDYEVTVVYVNSESKEYWRQLRCYTDPSNGGGTGGSGEVWQDCDNNTGVWTGVIQVTKQWDNPFKGGPDMRLGRIGPENISSASGRQITAVGWSNFMRKDLRRKDVNNKYIVAWSFSFDDEWLCEDAPQHFVYYEEDDDSKSGITVKGTLAAKAKVDVGDLVDVEVGPGAELSYSYEKSTDDDLVWSTFLERDEFYRWNDEDGGCGLHEGWRKRACENDDGFITLPSRF